MSPKAEEIILQTAAVALVAVIVYVAFTNPASTEPETMDGQTGRHKNNLSKNKSNSMPANRKLLQTRITDLYSPYSTPYGNASVNRYYRSQALSIINKSSSLS
jgi:hypothetical protein